MMRHIGSGVAWLAVAMGAHAQPASDSTAGTQPASPPGAPAARATPKATADLWNFPQGTIAFWAVSSKLPAAEASDPTRLLVERALLSVLRGAVRVQGGGTSIVDRVLDPEVLKGRAYRACLLECSGSPNRNAGESGVGLERLVGVVEIRSGADHERLIAALQGALGADERARKAPGGVARPLKLPGGVTGMTYARAGEDEWREVSWCSLESSFLIGFGPGAIERWVLAEAGRDPAACEWVLHRGNVARKKSGGEAVFEAFVDMNALRRGLPELFANGPLGELARSWMVGNARTLMVLARTHPAGEGKGRVLGVDLAWSSRAERPGLGRTMTVAESSWPAGAAPPAKEAWGLAIKPAWPSCLSMVGDSYRALSESRAAQEFAAARQAYLLRRSAALQRVLARLGEHAFIEPAGVDGVVIRIPLREGTPTPGVKAPTLDADLREVLALPDVTFDGGSRAWSLRLSQAGANGAAPLFPLDFCWRLSKDGTALEGRWGEWAREKAAPPARK